MAIETGGKGSAPSKEQLELQDFVQGVSSTANAAQGKAAANGFNAQQGAGAAKASINAAGKVIPAASAGASAAGTAATPKPPTLAQQQAHQKAVDKLAASMTNSDQQLISAVSGTAQTIADDATNWASNLPTPGGVAILLICLIFFIWAVVPVNNGLTRVQLLYLTLTGKTFFTHGSSGSFGPTTAPTSIATPAQLAYQVGVANNFGGNVNSTGGNVLQAQPDFTVM